AINAFGKASFFLPHKPQPFFAAAECFVSLCDFKGAVKQYRRALWLLRPRDDTESVEHPFGSALQPEKPSRCSDFSGRVSAFSIIEGEKDEGRESDHNDDFMLSTTDSSSRIATAEATPPPSAFRARAAAAAGDDRAIAGAVKTRLAGILDALSIVLFNVKDYGQALRFADDSLELCEHPQVMLHRCAYLVALERSDEAEKALEKHLKEHPCFFIESSSLLVHLYCQRQAFRHAKELLESVPLNDRQHAQIVLAQRIFD
ncbi:tetratricopeptide repeat protein 16, partial [Trypanosoma cruzi]